MWSGPRLSTEGLENKDIAARLDTSAQIVLRGVNASFERRIELRGEGPPRFPRPLD